MKTYIISLKGNKNMSENCTHDCSTCSANCSSRQKSREEMFEQPNALSSVKHIIGVCSG